MCAKDKYEKPEISVCFFEQVPILNNSDDENQSFNFDNIFQDDFQ